MLAVWPLLLHVVALPERLILFGFAGLLPVKMDSSAGSAQDCCCCFDFNGECPRPGSHGFRTSSERRESSLSEEEKADALRPAIAW